MAYFEVTLLILLRTFHVLPTLLLPRRKVPLTMARECSLPCHALQLGVWGSAQAPPAGPGGARLPIMHFDYLKTKSLAMTDLEVTLLIHLRFHHPLPHRKGPLIGL